MQVHPTPQLAKVACGTCRACCRWDAIEIRPQSGDDPTRYETTEMGGRLWLKRKENGECLYLGEEGCTIWPNHPAICRVFDCAAFFLMRSRDQRRELIRKGLGDKAVLEAGRIRARGFTDVGAYMKRLVRTAYPGR